MDIQIIRSRRKTISLQILPTGELLVRCPLRMKEKEIRSFVQSKQGWIEAHLPKGPVQPKLTDQEIKKLAELAKPGDLILTVGAGNIYLAGEALVKMEEGEQDGAGA